MLTLAQAVRALAVAPREVLGLPVPSLAEGAEANLTIFDATTAWTFEARHIQSKSRNTPFVGAPMTGKGAVVNNGLYVEASL